MKIKNMFDEKRPTVSFEVFPPKKDYPIETIYDTIESLKDLDPDFISVTYGAGGSTQNNTIEIASRIKNHYGIESIAHLTCISSSRETIRTTIETLKASGVENILALRGDIPEALVKSGFKPAYPHTVDLIEEIKKSRYFSIGGAAYPEGHVESLSRTSDIKYLKSKVDHGLDFLITQLFFDNRKFYQFKESLDLLDIKVPVIAGIFPVVNLRQINHVQALTGTRLPSKFSRIIDRYQDKPEALREAGIAYAVNQIIDLLSSGVDGIHLYTMNQPMNTRKIMEPITTIRKTLTQK